MTALALSLAVLAQRENGYPLGRDGGRQLLDTGYLSFSCIFWRFSRKNAFGSTT
jgi:hypothetical protein